MTTEQDDVFQYVSIQVGIPNPGEESVPYVVIEFVDQDKATYEMAEVAKFIRAGVANGWAAALDFVHTNTGLWRGEAVAHAEGIPDTELERIERK